MKPVSLPKESIVVSESIQRGRSGEFLPVIRRWRSSYSNAEISRMERFNVLRSSSTLNHFIETKRLEMLLLGLSEQELQAMIDLPGFLQDQLFQNALLAKSALLSHEDDHFVKLTKLKFLVKRLQRLQLLLGKVPWSYHLLNTWLNDLNYCLTLSAERIRPFKKYSGYCKTPSSFGNKNGIPPSRPEDLETDTGLNYEERNLVPFLISPTEDYSLLGFPPGSPLYKSLMSAIIREEVVSEPIRTLILKVPIDSHFAESWLF